MGRRCLSTSRGCGIVHENQYSRQGIRGEFERMERETGIEPATSSLGSWRSTAELLPLAGDTAARLPLMVGLLQRAGALGQRAFAAS